jgi:hypothetical protein
MGGKKAFHGIHHSRQATMTQNSERARAPFSFFNERNEKPGRGDVRRILAKGAAAWDDLDAMLNGEFHLTARLHYMYGKRYGWALRFERSGRLVAAMYPNRGHLFVQIILNRAQVIAAQAMKLPVNVDRALTSAKPYPKERWLFISVRSRKEARELQSMLTLKLSRSDD